MPAPQMNGLQHKGADCITDLLIVDCGLWCGRLACRPYNFNQQARCLHSTTWEKLKWQPCVIREQTNRISPPL